MGSFRRPSDLETLDMNTPASKAMAPGFPPPGRGSVGGLEYFNRIITGGTVERSRPYMSGFTLERLSRQHVADIRGYVQLLPQ
jgi:hypothetical protein